MKASKWIVCAGVAGVLSAVASVSAAQAGELRYATGFAPNSTGAKAADVYAEKAKEYSGGDIDMKVFAQSLLSFSEMSPGVRDGIADIGMVLFPYFPAEFPNSTMVSEMTMLFSLHDTNNRGGLAWHGALVEYIMLNCDKCRGEIKAQNQVFTSTSSTEYMLMCIKPIEKAQDMQGVRIRAPGAHWTRWAQSLGAVSVSIPQNEIFEGLSQGLLDCSLNGAAELVDLGLMDVVKYVIRDVPGGGFGGTAQSNVNLDVWTGLSPEQRLNLLKASNYHGALNSWNYNVNNQAALAKAEERGIDVIEPAQEFIDATRAFTQEDLQTIAKSYAEKYQLEGTDEAIAKMQELFEKWVGLVQDIDSADAFADLVWNEAVSKVDVASYGQ